MKLDFSKIREVEDLSLAQLTDKDHLQLLSCLDYTTLSSADTTTTVNLLCDKAKQAFDDFGVSAASICVYPVFVNEVKKALKGYPINVTSVAGNFPSSQAHINIKTHEIKWAIDEGADEIDVVLPRRYLLEDNLQGLTEELLAMRQAAQNKVLKVILESGELETEALITTASNLAMNTGADFVKTSTGKEAVGATLQHCFIMLEAIKNYKEVSGKIVGIKPSGGISTTFEAYKYQQLARKTLGETFMAKSTFRLGASRLFDDIINQIKK